MSGYLTNLAARALGVSEIARPRPSLFEPRRGVEQVPVPAEAELLGARPERDSVPEQPSARRPVEPPPPIDEQEVISAPDVGGEPQPVPPSQPPLRPARRLEKSAPRRPRPAVEPDTSERVGEVLAGDSLVSELTAAVVEAGWPRRRPAPPLLRPARLPPRVRPPKPEPESTVRVTIGRIEVRAVKADEPPTPPTKRKLAQRMSLDEYLARPSR